MSGETDAAKPRSSLLPRTVTGVVAAAIVVGMLYTTSEITFVFWLALFFWAATEFVRIVRHFAPTAPLRSLWLWIPMASVGGYFLANSPEQAVTAPLVLVLTFGLVLVALLSCLFQTSGELRDGAIGAGLMALAIPYFAAPPLAMYWLHRIDQWLVLLLLLIVAIGDTVAYFAGRAFGRHLLAPRVSPKKTWEGSIAGFTGSLIATAIWCQVHLGEIPLALLALASVTAVVAQLGDLVESLFKRGAGVKDSSSVLPGHGGFYDRLDALLLATPTFAVGLWLIGTGLAHP